MKDIYQILIAIILGITLAALDSFDIPQDWFTLYRENHPNDARNLLLIEGCPVERSTSVYIKPLFSKQAVLDWGYTQSYNLHNIDYLNYDMRLLANKDKFTPWGWCSFMEALFKADIPNSLVKGKIRIHISFPKEGKAIFRNKENNLNIWELEMPVVFEYNYHDSKGKTIPSVNGKMIIDIIEDPVRKETGSPFLIDRIATIPIS